MLAMTAEIGPSENVPGLPKREYAGVGRDEWCWGVAKFHGKRQRAFWISSDIFQQLVDARIP
jgi:hypothetical protein